MNLESENCCDLSDVEAMNRTCFCLPLERAKIDASISERSQISEIGDLLKQRTNLFANTSVFISSENVAAMQRQIDAFEALAMLAPYQLETLGELSDEHADLYSVQAKTKGLFMGYDFHITADGPRLIEVNTNAGGAFLMAHLKNSLESDPAEPDDGDLFFETFIKEWRATGREDEPKSIAIVDQNPTDQYLYPDMLFAKEYLSERGIETFICDPSELRSENGRLYFEQKPIDMVYNRLTDFMLVEPSNQILRGAFVRDEIVLSPAPRHHTLYANKTNLTRLENTRLRAFGLAEEHVAALDEVPKTIEVSVGNAEAFWASRKQYFFKPQAGFGGRATYRGSKLTKRVFAEISKGGYIAQRFIPPTTRALKVDGESKTLKYDLRVYTYAGKSLLMAARVYQGQTTNFRTDGGGFATVFEIPNS